jgi:hypothetical protein
MTEGSNDHQAGRYVRRPPHVMRRFVMAKREHTGAEEARDAIGRRRNDPGDQQGPAGRNVIREALEKLAEREQRRERDGRGHAGK